MLHLILLSSFEAHAFCGTYVSGYEDAPQNSASEVAIVRQGNLTTLTVANDVQGDTRKFAMVVPVPTILERAAINVVNPAVFDHIREYSNPREVSYTCADFETDTDTDTDADSDADADYSDTGDAVEVEAQYIVGEYDVSILSADESGALVDWLQRNGYFVPDSSAELFASYIEGGSYFFAAQVREDAGISSGTMLSPLQFSYESEPFALPIRIGTLNSPGEQDLRIYAITDYDAGQIGIANYPEAQVDHDCMWQPQDGESITGYYDRQVDAAFASVPGASWINEYAWGNGSCDPCTGVIPSAEDVYTLGYKDDYHYGQYYYFTRLHMRYTPETAKQDLTLYTSNIQSQTQMRFIAYDERMEDHFPVCNVGMLEDPGSCESAEPEELTVVGDVAWLGDGCGCAAPGGGQGTWGLLLLAGGVASRGRRGRT